MYRYTCFMSGYANTSTSNEYATVRKVEDVFRVVAKCKAAAVYTATEKFLQRHADARDVNCWGTDRQAVNN